MVRSVSLACRASPDRIDYLGLGSKLRVAIVAAHLHVSVLAAVGEIRALKSGAGAGIMARLFGSQIANTGGAWFLANIAPLAIIGLLLAALERFPRCCSSYRNCL